MISARTKAALAAAKARGVKLGSPVAAETIVEARKVRSAGAKAKAKNLVAIVRDIERSGVVTLSGIARALEARGVETGPWFDRQLALSLLGALVQFGWEKALGGYDEELRWWENQAVRASSLLG